MPDIVQLIQDIMSLTKTVGGLEHDVERLQEKVENHTERIVKLEQREELLAERMTNRAITAVNEMNGRIFERLSSLEQRFPSHGDSRKSLPG
jgi:uncharacterized protein YhaN